MLSDVGLTHGERCSTFVLDAQGGRIIRHGNGAGLADAQVRPTLTKCIAILIQWRYGVSERYV